MRLEVAKMHSESRFTIKKLLETYRVYIPAIQRDYAFGRTGVQNTSKREKFIGNMVNSLIHNSPVHLDFVYGLINDNSFIPLDGQQRITTLWLIEVYISKNIKTDLDSSYLDRFSYDTRTSTREFCRALLTKNWKLNNISIEKSQVIEYFYNCKWFFNSWRHDPSITGMIIVLEEIHRCINRKRINDLRTNNITFTFLNIDNLGNSEELYIKMNSRGRELSDWDEFKAELFELIEDISNDTFNAHEYEKWIDGRFIDFFWTIGKDSKDKSKLTEIRMLRLFYLFIYFRILENRDSHIFSSHEEVIRIIGKDWKSVITVEVLLEIRYFVEYIVKNREAIKGISFKRFPNDGLRIDELFDIFAKTDLNRFQADIDLFYAYKLFINKRAKDYSSISEITEEEICELKQVVRIISNFEETYRKQFSIEYVFIDSIRYAILSPKGILNFFETLDSKSINLGSHSDEQLEEEIVKSKLILRDSRWEEIIYKVESHPLLNGTVGWLLRVSNEDLEEFKKFSSIVLEKFDHNGIKDLKEIARILKYIDIRDNNNLFPKNLGYAVDNLLRDYSWKKYFRGYGYKKTIASMQDVSLLRDYINQNEVELPNERWRQWLIYYPEILKTIGAIRINYFGDSGIFGIQWNVKRFSSIKYDIPLMALKVCIKGLQYQGFRAEGESSFAHYRDVKIGFDYSKNEYLIFKKEIENRIDVSEIKTAVKKLENVLISISDSDK